MIKELKNFCLDILFPKYCLGCGKENSYICLNCLKQIQFLDHQFGEVIAGCRYGGIVKKLLCNFKFGFIKELAPILGEILRTQFVYYSQYCSFLKEAVLVPVPLHKRRIFYRGFNQNLKLAEYLRKTCGNSLCDCLIKKDDSRPQNELTREERLSNLKGKFSLKNEFRSFLNNKDIILIDDVVTTGTTLKECIKALKMANVRNVIALVVAKSE